MSDWHHTIRYGMLTEMHHDTSAEASMINGRDAPVRASTAEVVLPLSSEPTDSLPTSAQTV